MKISECKKYLTQDGRVVSVFADKYKDGFFIASTDSDAWLVDSEGHTDWSEGHCLVREYEHADKEI